MYTEARQRGWNLAQRKVVIADRAEWIRDIACALLTHPNPELANKAASTPNTSNAVPSACVVRNSAASICSQAPESSRLVIRQLSAVSSRQECSGQFAEPAVIAFRCSRLSGKFEG
jgi:hypothetical protein